MEPGSVVAGKYRIESLLGEGGMGSVFLATNQVLHKRVALKLMSRRFVEVPEAGERFLREGIAAARVSHASIVQVFDAGVHEGLPWMAMELLEGETLSQRLARGPLSLDETLVLARGVLSALFEVHSVGIVHRDLKPENIFLARAAGGGWVPKILDFGVAKDTSDNQLSKLTATGAVVGTAFYLSPEQAKCMPDIDARTDLYAMGVVLFEALSGQYPYEAQTVTQLVAKMFTESPRRLLDVAPHVPPPISDVVATCLASDRDKRFQSARALLSALEAAISSASADPKMRAGFAATALAPAV
ncbi:MAG: serine/threonine protein kinase, partial [Sandaracinaceae bacterium]|nr:serine/threonine protein kinase [Sandaracinaceae bacterium]